MNKNLYLLFKLSFFARLFEEKHAGNIFSNIFYCDQCEHLNLNVCSGFLWTNGQVPYEIAGDFNATQKKTIEDAVLFYNEEFKDCIKWIPK